MLKKNPTWCLLGVPVPQALFNFVVFSTSAFPPQPHQDLGVSTHPDLDGCEEAEDEQVEGDVGEDRRALDFHRHVSPRSLERTAVHLREEGRGSRFPE